MFFLSIQAHGAGLKAFKQNKEMHAFILFRRGGVCFIVGLTVSAVGGSFNCTACIQSRVPRHQIYCSACAQTTEDGRGFSGRGRTWEFSRNQHGQWVCTHKI